MDEAPLAKCAHNDQLICKCMHLVLSVEDDHDFFEQLQRRQMGMHKIIFIESFQRIFFFLDRIELSRKHLDHTIPRVNCMQRPDAHQIDCIGCELTI